MVTVYFFLWCSLEASLLPLNFLVSDECASLGCVDLLGVGNFMFLGGSVSSSIS